MLVINYNGNKPITDYFKFSVQGNNNADKIRFLVSLNQSGLVFNNNYHIYAKVQCVDDDFYDKVELSEINFDDSNNLLDVYFSLEAKHTSHRQIEVSLSCEDLNNEIVWQTAIVKLAIMGGVNADEGVENLYPSILQQLQKQIDELKQQGGGGGASSVEIEKVWLTYDDKKSLVANYVGTIYGDDKPFINDSTRIWVNFKTTPINAQMEEEIKNGRFIIRLDYPIIKAKKLTQSAFVEHQPQGDYGFGYKSFTRTFNEELNGARKDLLRDILLNSLIFINESDIKTNKYGEKYIHKKISFFDYVNKTCQLVQGLSPLTNAEIQDDAPQGRLMFDYFLDDIFYCGIPHTSQRGSVFENENGSVFAGRAKMKIWAGRSHNDNPKECMNVKKLNPAFGTYCLMKTSSPESSGDFMYLSSPYFVSKNKSRVYGRIDNNFVLVELENGVMNEPNRFLRRYSYMSAKPRCAVLNDDYETSNEAFLKLYPQADQNIRVFCKYMLDIEDYDYEVLPIFRMLITQK